jgi:16S rRNA (adenine1518-N6/adenine1519-N6)-dimethyltransferase
VVEIGPGLGALTGPLLERCAALDVIEIDRDLSARLHDELGDRPGLRIHCADALTVDLGSLATGGEGLRVVGNLPYNLSTPLLFHLLKHASVVTDMHLMLQREVVDRLVARPGGGDYGRLTVMVGLWCTCEKLFNVASGSFRPAPRVTSAVARLRVRESPAVQVAHPPTFQRLVARLFSQRRKTLRNGLRGLLDEAQLEDLGIDPRARPETLELAQFAALANALDDLGHQV